MQKLLKILPRDLKGFLHSEISHDSTIFLKSPRPFVIAYFHSEEKNSFLARVTLHIADKLQTDLTITLNYR